MILSQFYRNTRYQTALKQWKSQCSVRLPIRQFATTPFKKWTFPLRHHLTDTFLESMNTYSRSSLSACLFLSCAAKELRPSSTSLLDERCRHLRVEFDSVPDPREVHRNSSRQPHFFFMTRILGKPFACDVPFRVQLLRPPLLSTAFETRCRNTLTSRTTSVSWGHLPGDLRWYAWSDSIFHFETREAQGQKFCFLFETTSRIVSTKRQQHVHLRNFSRALTHLFPKKLCHFSPIYSVSSF